MYFSTTKVAMKKIALATLLIPSLVFSYIGLDELEKAIMRSNLKRVLELEPKPSLDGIERNRLLDLSQQVIKQRKNNFKYQRLSPRVPIYYKCTKEENLLNLGAFICSLVGAGCTSGAGCTGLNATSDEEIIGCVALAGFASLSFLLSATFFFGSLSKIKLRHEKKLEDLYDNAIQIRTLLWKCYSRKEKV